MSAKRIKTKVDFHFANHGSVVLVRALTPDAKQLVADKFVIEPWQWMGNAFAVDHRVAQDLINQLNFDGYTLSGE